MEKLTKDDLRKPDAFVSNVSKFTEYSFKHRVPILIVVSLGVVIGLLWAGWGMYSDSREEQAQVSLYSVESKLKTIEDGFAKGGKESGQLDVDYKDVIPALKDVTSKFSSTQASVLAAIDMARLYLHYKKYDEITATLEPMVERAGHPVTKAVVLNYLGVAAEGKGDCKKAIGYWDKMANDKLMAFFQGGTYIKSGLCYEKLKEVDKAEQSYRKAEALTGDPESVKLAKKYLRLLKKG